MTPGSINFSRQATLPIAVMNNNNRQFVQVHAIIDTGFSGHLQLPSDEIDRLSLLPAGTIGTELADGSAVESRLYKATVLWFGNLVSVDVLAAEVSIRLIGAKLLWGSVTHIEWEFGGAVTVGPISRPETEG